MLILMHNGYTLEELEELHDRTYKMVCHFQANTGYYNCLDRIPDDCKTCNIRNLCRDIRNLHNHVEELIRNYDKNKPY